MKNDSLIIGYVEGLGLMEIKRVLGDRHLLTFDWSEQAMDGVEGLNNGTRTT